MNIKEKLMKIQAELKAPKNQFNSFGKYNYRSCEDILEGLKPLLLSNKAILIIDDEIMHIGDRYYVRATATLTDVEKEEYIDAVAYAREDETKKGMDLAQVTGSTSSYARKYALNGLFAIDDTKDSDTTNTHGKEPDTPSNTTTDTKVSALSEKQIARLYAIGKSAGYDTDTVNSQINVRYKKIAEDLTKAEYDTVCKGYEGLKK